MTAIITKINHDNLKEVSRGYANLEKHLTNLLEIAKDTASELWIRVDYETGRMQFQLADTVQALADEVDIDFIMNQESTWAE